MPVTLRALHILILYIFSVFGSIQYFFNGTYLTSPKDDFNELLKDL